MWWSRTPSSPAHQGDNNFCIPHLLQEWASALSAYVLATNPLRFIRHFSQQSRSFFSFCFLPALWKFSKAFPESTLYVCIRSSSFSWRKHKPYIFHILHAFPTLILYEVMKNISSQQVYSRLFVSSSQLYIFNDIVGTNIFFSNICSFCSSALEAGWTRDIQKNSSGF